VNGRTDAAERGLGDSFGTRLEAATGVQEGAKTDAARRTLVVRAFLVHMLAYAIAFPWAVGSLPFIFLRRQDELLAMADENAAAIAMLKATAVPALLAFLVGHAVGLPWILAAKRGASSGRALFWIAFALLLASGVGVAAWGWIRLLT
jgi:hypothetical protein